MPKTPLQELESSAGPDYQCLAKTSAPSGGSDVVALVVRTMVSLVHSRWHSLANLTDEEAEDDSPNNSPKGVQCFLRAVARKYNIEPKGITPREYSSGCSQTKGKSSQLSRIVQGPLPLPFSVEETMMNFPRVKKQ
ncbi:hypothetical protein HGM15179_008671 [Zosterops borbonicus]|uniref:Uncharacterized protein n=1 Tax=Zosterops borbonicus TaxID=364589 RepID=A0A8K1GIZ0_9PASS|nr:hypothetical protein HGM15179_008671 [Zosterops borbonicus]